MYCCVMDKVPTSWVSPDLSIPALDWGPADAIAASRWQRPGVAQRVGDWLGAALAEGGIAAHYQPIVRLADGALDTVEVLARLRDPRLGVIPPDVFVPLIERAGLSEQLMKAVLITGLPELRRLAALPGHVPAAFNLPLEMVLRADSLHWMDDQRARLGLDTSDLAVELTESHPVVDLPGLARALERWTASGYRMSIDDVTPGLANHRALLDLPFHYAKLDRSVTRDSAASPAIADFLGDFVAAAQSRGKQVIAEGIENVADWARMRALGIDLAQGFLISPALPAPAIAGWMDCRPGRWVYAHTA
jgi:EAL domain-containing protein (putative c-di-GMP-specific phosphodiesterase class I)